MQTGKLPFACGKAPRTDARTGHRSVGASRVWIPEYWLILGQAVSGFAGSTGRQDRFARRRH
jgi:hypothetical protein